MNYLISISGIPGSGKSTLAEVLLKKNPAVHISSDLIRREYFGDPSLQELRYHKPLIQAVIKILDDRLELNLLKKNNIIYDSVQSSPHIRERQIALSSYHHYQYIAIELLFTPKTLEKRIKKRKSDPYGSEAGVDVMRRFWAEKISHANLSRHSDEFEIIFHFVRKFQKIERENCLSILIYETKGTKPNILYGGESFSWLRECLDEFVNFQNFTRDLPEN